jgi:hypothetical protein
MLPTTITSEELRRLTNYSKAQLVELEQAGIIERAAKNTWSIGTVTKIVARLRERGRRPVDDDRARFEAARAGREKLKLMKECNEVVYLREFKLAVDAVAFSVLTRLSPLSARIGERDLALRKRVDDEVRSAQALMSQDMKALADGLAETGKAP